MKIIRLDPTIPHPGRSLWCYYSTEPGQAAKEYKAKFGHEAKTVYAVTVPRLHNKRTDSYIFLED